MNERLRGALLQRGLTVEQLAEACGVDPKTAGRWISLGRAPHRTTRETVAEVLGTTEAYLWPQVDAGRTVQSVAKAQAEIVAVYPDRASVPRDVWLQLLKSSQERIDVLVFSGTFLAQTNPRIAEMLRERTVQGVQVRMCFADPDGSAVAQRDAEEGLHGTLGAKIRACMSYFVKLIDTPNFEMRLHNSTLYASIFRYDDHALINPHIWGRPASGNPLLHVRQVGDENMFDKYTEGFENVWKEAVPWQGPTRTDAA